VPFISLFDRLGRLTSVKRNGNNHAEYTYSPNTFRLTLEKLNRDTHERHLHRHYDNPTGRPLSLDLTTTGGTSQYTTGYGYDTAGRLDQVWHHPSLDATSKIPTGNPTFTYGYTYTQAQAGALRVGATTGQDLKQDLMPYTVTKNAWSGSPAFTANRTYEGTREALRSIENRVDGSLVSGYTYQVNQIDQRVSVQTAGSAFGVAPNFDPADWAWDYNARGELVAADSPTTARDRAFEYDSIGNRKKFAHGTLNLPASDNFQANALNQYQAVPDFAPQPGFDPDGNMTSGPVPGSAGNTPGIQAPADATLIEWDAENRMIACKIGTTTYRYEYDYLSRLTARKLDTLVMRRYHYDGWNRIAEYFSDNPIDTFTWGLDLSGTLQGAGGVGGLLATRWLTATGSPDYFPTFDGNGNISEYLKADGDREVHYEYDPFGTLTRLTGNTTVKFQYRFSTKPRDFSTGLYYYGYRWFDPVTGRWPSRDPIGERGGLNLYGFVGNDGVNWVDILGYFGFSAKWNRFHFEKAFPNKISDYHKAFPDGAKGHADFPGAEYFDYNAPDIRAEKLRDELKELEKDKNSKKYKEKLKEYIEEMKKHFQTYEISLAAVRKAIEDCDINSFQDNMHYLQDSFVHSRFRMPYIDPNGNIRGGHATPLYNNRDTGGKFTPDFDNDAWEKAKVITDGLQKEYRDKCRCKKRKDYKNEVE
jgi:RHS repeat-associated protein